MVLFQLVQVVQPVRLLPGKTDFQGAIDEIRKQREKYEEERKELIESTMDGGKDSDELHTELKKLEKLRDSMIITEQEFDVLKKRLLEKY